MFIFEKLTEEKAAAAAAKSRNDQKAADVLSEEEIPDFPDDEFKGCPDHPAADERPRTQYMYKDKYGRYWKVVDKAKAKKDALPDGAVDEKLDPAKATARRLRLTRDFSDDYGSYSAGDEFDVYPYGGVSPGYATMVAPGRECTLQVPWDSVEVCESEEGGDDGKGGVEPEPTVEEWKKDPPRTVEGMFGAFLEMLGGDREQFRLAGIAFKAESGQLMRVLAGDKIAGDFVVTAKAAPEPAPMALPEFANGAYAELRDDDASKVRVKFTDGQSPYEISGIKAFKDPTGKNGALFLVELEKGEGRAAGGDAEYGPVETAADFSKALDSLAA